MRILIVGAGSTGGYFGGRLAQAGRDVTFLVRPARAEALGRDGLQIVSPHGDAVLQPKLVTAGGLIGPFDAILLTVKGFSLDGALNDMAPAVGPNTMIFPVLNGMRHVDLIADRFGKTAVAGCACKVATIVDERGRIVQLTPLQDIAYGEMDGSLTTRMRSFDQAMQGAGFDARISSDISREMWEKWLLLASIGGITCLMRGNIGEVEAAPGGAAFALAFFNEVTTIIRAVGKSPSDSFVASTKTLLTQKGSVQTSSMYRDLQRGVPIEAEQIIGDLIVRAKASGIAAPLLSAAHSHLMIYQSRALAQRGQQ
jgi:2-dehydropantoate 2-reductase